MSSTPRRCASLATLALATVTMIGVTTAGAAVGPSIAPSASTVVIHRIAPHTTGVVAHTYFVNTTADAVLAGAAYGEHLCQDSTNTMKCSLRAAVQAANSDFENAPNSWDVIMVPAGTYNLLSSVSASSLFVNNEGDLSIEGAGPTKTVINGYSLDNTILTMDYANDTLAVTGVGFTDGSEESGGAVFVDNDSGASFSDCAFTHDEALTGAGIYASPDTTVSVVDSTFTDGISNYSGGAIYDESGGILTVSGDTFSHNSTEATANYFGGGAIYSDSYTSVTDSNFDDNTTEGVGGALALGYTASVANSTFSGNDADEYGGGAVYADNDIIISDSAFTGNEGDQGGSIYVERTATLNGDQFVSGEAYEGGDVYDAGNATITQSSSSKSTAADAGGSIYVADNALSMSADTISHAKAEGSSVGGGGVFGYEGVLSLTNVSISDSSATGSDGYGGGLVCADCKLSEVGGSFSHDTAAYGGGGAYVTNGGSASFDGTAFTDNTSDWGGGVLVYEDGTLNIAYSAITGNNSNYYWGGGVSGEDQAYMSITNSSITGNHADSDEFGYGGGVAVYPSSTDSTLQLVEDTVANNQAYYGGGGIYADQAGIYVASSTVTGNTIEDATYANDGGGIDNTPGGAFTTIDSIWSGNEGRQCYSEVGVSGGYNLDSDNSCGLYANGDIVSHAATLGPLQNNGGPTETVAPLSGSLAISHGGSSCLVADQRGVVMPAGSTCDIGSVFVQDSTAAITLTSATVAKGHEQADLFKFSVTSKLKGAKPAGTVKVMAGSKEVCSALVTAGPSTTSTGVCAMAPSKLNGGTYKMTAQYVGSGDLAGSTSGSKNLKVT